MGTEKVLIGIGSNFSTGRFHGNLEETWENQRLSAFFSRPMFFLVTLNGPCTPGKEAIGKFKDDFGTNPTACLEDAGQDGAGGEGPRLLT